MNWNEVEGQERDVMALSVHHMLSIKKRTAIFDSFTKRFKNSQSANHIAHEHPHHNYDEARQYFC